MYTRMRKSQVATHTDHLKSEMEKLQQAIKRVSENWNDVVAQGIQTSYINSIISACNSVNSTLTTLSIELDSDLTRLEELSKECQ